MNAPLIDPFARAITYLRVSVTDRCDFRCVYCMSENMTFLPKKELLTLEELDRLCSTFVGMGVEKLRITGGEPLVRKGIMTFFQSMSHHLEAGTLKELKLGPLGHSSPAAPITMDVNADKFTVTARVRINRNETAIVRIQHDSRISVK